MRVFRLIFFDTSWSIYRSIDQLDFDFSKLVYFDKYIQADYAAFRPGAMHLDGTGKKPRSFFLFLELIFYNPVRIKKMDLQKLQRRESFNINSNAAAKIGQAAFSCFIVNKTAWIADRPFFIKCSCYVVDRQKMPQW